MDRRLGRPLPYQQPNPTQASPKADKSFNPKTICGISYPFGQLSLTLGQIPTRYSAVRRSPAFCTISLKSPQTLTPLEMMRLISLRKSPRPGFKLIVQNPLPLDLHVLGTPPAFILSQDQTLR